MASHIKKTKVVSMDVALIMSGTLSGKSVRHAYRVMTEVRGEQM